MTADLAKQPDHVLIERCQAGDESAFEVIYQRYRLPLFAYIHKLLPGNNPLVDDIFQMTWLKTVSNWHRYQEQQRLLAWICRIAHNLVMDHYRRQGRAEMVEMTENLASAYPEAATLIDETARDKALEEAIAKLPEEQQEVIKMRREGASFKEIAEKQKINLNTALGRMHYAVRKIRQLMEDYL